MIESLREPDSSVAIALQVWAPGRKDGDNGVVVIPLFVAALHFVSMLHSYAGFRRLNMNRCLGNLLFPRESCYFRDYASD